MPPVRDLETFYKALRKTVKRGYKFEVYKGKQNRGIFCKIRYHASDIPCYMSPIQMIWYEFFGGKTDKWASTKWIARRVLKMQRSTFEEIELACMWFKDFPGDKDIRRQIKEICGL